MPADPYRIATLFAAAVAKPAEQRAAYLDQACGGDAELRRRVEALLQAHDDAGSFLEKPAPAASVTTDLPAGQWIDRDAPSELAEGPGTRIGPYKLLQKIGEGGMGVVYMAEQQEPIRRMVALKIIKPGMDSAAVVARFEAERQALALMDHQNIARVFDGGTTESGRPFFVMELVKGIPITRFCDENRLTPRERLELFVPVCEAVQHAHQKGVIHRDLKPSNVLVTLYDGKPVPKVIDFGVAKALHQKLTERTMFTAFGTVVGTLEYMSPEQAEMNALDVDTRSDVYSLGVLLYELLTGTTPLERKRLRQAAYTEMLRLIREEEPPRPSLRISDPGEALARISAQRKTEPAQLARLVRGELDWIVMKALEKDRGRRYGTATGLAQDVEHYLKDEPVEACPPSVAYRLHKFTRKYRVMLSTAAAFAALLLIASGVSIWLAVAAQRAEERANKRSDDAEVARQEANDERDRADKAAKNADDERRRADGAAREATAKASDFRRSFDRMSVARGIQLADEGRHFTAWPWLIKPLEHEIEMSDDEKKAHRTRIACHLRYTPGCPKLRRMFFCDEGLNLPDPGVLKGLRGKFEQPVVSFSADCKRMLAVAGGIVYVWDLQRGFLLARLQPPGGVYRAQFNQTGTRVLTASNEAAVLTWDAETGTLLGPPVVDWAGLLLRPMALLPLSPWQFLTSVGVQPWEYAGWVLSSDGSICSGTDISADGRRALFTYPRFRRLLDLERNTLIGQWPYSFFAELSPDGRFLAERDENLVRIHDATGQKAGTRSIDHGSGVSSFEFSPDGTRALTVGGNTGNDFARIWDTSTWKPLSRMRVPFFYPFWSISPDNRMLAAWSDVYDRLELALWDVQSGQLVHRTAAKNEVFTYMEWRPDNKQLLLISSANGGQIVLLNEDSNWNRALVLPHFGVGEAHYAPDGRNLVTASRDGTIRIWDLCDRDEPLTWQAPEKNELTSDIRLSVHIKAPYPGIRSVYASNRREVKTVAASKQFAWLDAEHLLPPGTTFSSGTLSPDRRRVITCHPGPEFSGQILKLWDTNTRQIIGNPWSLIESKEWSLGWRSSYTCVVFSPDSRLFAAASGDLMTWVWQPGKAQLYDAKTGELVGRSLKHDAPVLFTAFSPDSELLVTCSADSTARLWKTKTGEAASPSLRHGSCVISAAFAPNGKIVATASVDGTVRLWGVNHGTPIGVLEVKDGEVWDLAFHPNSSLLLVSFTNKQGKAPDQAGAIRIFDIASLQEVSPPSKGFDFSDRLRFRLRKDGRIAFGLFDRRTWDLTPDNRPVGDLTRLGELVSGRRADAGGGTSPLEKEELQARWHELSAKYPAEFTVSPKSAVDWRIEQLQLASKRERPFEIAFHRRWLAAELAEVGWQPRERGNEDMNRGNYLQRLYALALHDHHAAATKAADDLAGRWSKDSDTQYKCACVHALAASAVKSDAALTERYAARAVALLRQAVKAGYNNGQHIRKDTDLDALRRRDGFRALLNKLDTKQP